MHENILMGCNRSDPRENADSNMYLNWYVWFGSAFLNACMVFVEKEASFSHVFHFYLLNFSILDHPKNQILYANEDCSMMVLICYLWPV